jgi:transcriptional regulator GlxA family with amidase domain
MKIAIITLEDFNELDSFVASAILHRVQRSDWTVQICCPTDQVTSMNGVRVHAQQPIEYANQADVVLFGSGMKTAQYADDPAFLKRFALDSSKQIIGAQY